MGSRTEKFIKLGFVILGGVAIWTTLYAENLSAENRQYEKPATQNETKNNDAPDEAGAIIACKEMVMRNANHPSTVDFSLYNASARQWGDGRTEVNATFTAKNSFNLEVNHTVRCLFQNWKLIDFDVKESR